MLKTMTKGWTILLSALLFTFLFYRQALGLNVLIYELLILAYLLFDSTISLKHQLQRAGFIAVLLTALFTVMHHSTLSFFVNFLVFFLFIGIVTVPEVRSLPLVAYNSLSSFIISQGLFYKEFTPKSAAAKRKRSLFRRLSIFLLPLIIILTFILIYSASNPKFGAFFEWLNQQIVSFFSTIFKYIELNALIVLAFGVVIGSFIFIRSKNSWAVETDAEHSDQLTRTKTKTKRTFRFMALYNEYRAAVFLFVGLNALLLFLNGMDIYYVWFNFTWSGQYLKDFVHQGTYLLLVSIIISIILVLFFFRKNLNFFSKNSFLKKLAYLWIFQNAILVISVGIRNWYYIQYYALAYKRIAIVFFLILTLFALFTVFLKISKVRSSYFMVRLNSLSLLFILVLSAGFNWDRIIANYNFSKADRSFVHLNYLSGLSDSALPYLQHPLEKIKDMDTKQMHKFSSFGSGSFDSGSFSTYRRTYLAPEDFVSTIHHRTARFKHKWQQKGWLSWNLAEYRAYEELMGR